MRWWAGKHLGGVAFVPPHGKPRLSYCVKYCELTALVAVRLDCASFCRLCQCFQAQGQGKDTVKFRSQSPDYGRIVKRKLRQTVYAHLDLDHHQDVPNVKFSRTTEFHTRS